MLDITIVNGVFKLTYITMWHHLVVMGNAWNSILCDEMFCAFSWDLMFFYFMLFGCHEI